MRSCHHEKWKSHKGNRHSRALEKTGVEFIDEDGGGPGVRLAKPKAKRKAK
jgi:hypothetical protein